MKEIDQAIELCSHAQSLKDKKEEVAYQWFIDLEYSYLDIVIKVNQQEDMMSAENAKELLN